MKKRKIAPIPPLYKTPFLGAINHPDLWLWDSWTSESFGAISLYCLALSKVDSKKKPIHPNERNEYSFHIRLFVSSDDGNSWMDQGAVFGPKNQFDDSDSSNIWSGSVFENSDTIIMAYTGLREISDSREFLQTICLAHTIGRKPNFVVSQPALSDPLRDYEDIVSSGYYLGQKDSLGASEGEDSGPILAWRDPYLFEEEDGVLYAFWSAKIGKKTPAIAWASLETSSDGLRLGKLRPPILLPVSHSVTQLELPKLYKDRRKQMYYCLVSACDRLTEGQPDGEISKEVHLFRSKDLQGDWEPYDGKSSLLSDFGQVFGASLVSIDYEAGTANLIAPYTEQAEADVQLSFPPLTQITFIDTSDD